MADKLTPTGRISKALTRAEMYLGKGASIPRGSRRRVVEITYDQMLRQMTLIPSLLDKSVCNYAIALRQNALRIFGESFKSKRFYSANSKPWKPITEGTWRLRLYHQDKYDRQSVGARDEILREFGYLKGSIRVRDEKNVMNIGLTKYTIWTDPESFKSPVHKGFVYAGIHNNPGMGDTYGRRFGAKKVVRRQFMGHSSYQANFIRLYQNNYLFHSIFLDT